MTNPIQSALSQNLARLIQSIQEEQSIDLEEVQELILETPENEVRSSDILFLKFCHSLTEAFVKTNRSVSGIHLLSQAIAKLQINANQLTPLHADLCLLCLDAKCLNPALPFLETVYTDIRKSDDKDEDSKSVMLFCYYGGLIYTAIKNFERASFYFENVLTMPANYFSPVMQETFKKQIIINLLLHGRLPENMLPKYTSACVTRQKRQVSQIYIKLAQEYPSLNYDKIQRSITTNSQTFERDENMGLMKQCLTQVHKRNVQRLTKTFLTLSLSDVASHMGLADEKEAEVYILNMIDDDEIFATINQKDGMVVFEDSPENFDTVSVFRTLQEDITNTIGLIGVLKKMESESAMDTKALGKLTSAAAADLQ